MLDSSTARLEIEVHTCAAHSGAPSEPKACAFEQSSDAVALLGELHQEIMHRPGGCRSRALPEGGQT